MGSDGSPCRCPFLCIFREWDYFQKSFFSNIILECHKHRLRVFPDSSNNFGFSRPLLGAVVDVGGIADSAARGAAPAAVRVHEQLADAAAAGAVQVQVGLIPGILSVFIIPAIMKFR